VVVELLLYEAYKLLVQPLIRGAQNGMQEMSEDAVKSLAGRFVRVAQGRLGVTEPAQADGKADPLEDRVIAAIEQGGQPDRLLVEDAGRGGGVPEGSDAWWVSSYEAVLWRVATLAGWARRPIAVAGALQGPAWVTVCVPHVQLQAGQVIDPSSLWQVTASGHHRRLTKPSADFFVRATEVGQLDGTLESLNEEFRLEPRFEPGPAGPDKATWHRVEGLRAGWVLFQWDDALTACIQELRNPAMWDGRYLIPVMLEASPPQWNELPPEWRGLSRIPDKTAGIVAVRNGADAYASVTATVLAQAKAALGLPD
jgi:hypothetical protein